MAWLKRIIKLLLKKALLVKVLPTPEVANIHKKFGNELLSERSFYFGGKKLRTTSLAMESAPGTAEVVIQLLRELGIGQGQKILDFGCGQHKSRYLRNMGFVVHSCDVLPLATENFTKIDSTSLVLPFADNQFDVVVASEVLEHTESPWEILKELARVSKQDVIITTPNPASIKSKKQFFKTGYLYWFAPENFSYHISPIFWWQIELFCQRHNLQLIQSLGNHQSFQLNDAERPIDFAESMIFHIRK